MPATITVIDDQTIIQVGENTVAAAQSANNASISATNAMNAATTALALTNYRATYADGIADFAVGDYFSTAESGSLRVYLRTGTTPFYVDQGDAVAPLTFANAARVAATRTALASSPKIGTVYVAEVNAFYDYHSSSAATADSWTVITPSVGSGRWLLVSEWLTFDPTGGDDTPTLTAAGNALAAKGKTLRLRPATYSIATTWAWPATAALTVVADPLTELASSIGAPNGVVSHAPLYCGPGGQDRSTTVVSANILLNNQIIVADTVSIGEMVRVRDTVTGGGFRGNRYTVMAVTPSGGDFVVTVDRPLMTQFGAGDEVYIWTSKRAFGHRFFGNGAKLTGNGSRGIEFICTEDCRFHDLIVQMSEANLCGSFDTCGYNNHWIRMEADGSQGTVEDGFWIETQERSSIQQCLAHDCHDAGTATGSGFRTLNCENCQVHGDSYGNDYGVMIFGEGGDLLGSRHMTVTGNYSGNATNGIVVGVASSDIRINAAANYNPVNLVIGDSGGGNVREVHFTGDFSKSHNTGVAGQGVGVQIAASALGVSGGVVDTSACAIGLSNASSSVSIQKHIHRDYLAAAGGCLLTSGLIAIHEVDYNPPSNSVVIVSVLTGGRADLVAGSIGSGTGCILVQVAGTGIATLGALVLSGGASTTALYTTNANAVIYVDQATRLSTVPIQISTSSLGTVHRPEKPLSQSVGAAGTTAVTTEETLKTYTVATTDLSKGSTMRIRASGTFAANANTKTLKLKLGATTLLTMAGGNSESWSIEATVFVTGLTAETYDVQAIHGSTPQAASGTATVDVTASPAVAITGQNGTASANDIVCNSLEIVRAAS